MNKKVLSLFLSLFILTITGGYSTVFASINNNVPPTMQPNTILIFNDDLTYDIIQGGELTESQLMGEDSNIDLAGINSTTLEAQPGIKVTYDQHGVISNVYYPSISNVGEYQLNNPKAPKNATGWLSPGTSTGNYGAYTNYDYGTTWYNKLSNSTAGIMTGTGRITYFKGQPGDHNNTLKLYDCATKMYVDDVSSGTKVTATNTYKNKTQYFTKQSCGSLPSAILDIWTDGTTYPIKDITTGGTVDNVYSAKITHVAS